MAAQVEDVGDAGLEAVERECARSGVDEEEGGVVERDWRKKGGKSASCSAASAGCTGGGGSSAIGVSRERCGVAREAREGKMEEGEGEEERLAGSEGPRVEGGGDGGGVGT